MSEISIPEVGFNKNEWATPQWLFDDCNAIWQFNIDVCALPHNHKCDRYFTPEIDALTQTLTYGDRAWMNPPYSNPGKWCDWAEQQANNGALVVGLLSCDTSTQWFHRVMNQTRTEIHPIKGRVKFEPPKGYPKKPTSPTSAHCIVVWYPKQIFTKRSPSEAVSKVRE